MNEAVLRNILTLGSMAPSGDNMQPWKFQWDGQILTVSIIPDADSSFYNANEYGSCIAVGACIKNILIAASKEGYEAHVVYSDEPLNIGWAAKITFSESKIIPDELITTISNRATNRTPYNRKPLKEEHIKNLQDIFTKYPGFSLKHTTDVNDISKLSKAISLNERLFLENKEIHQGLFSTITWSKKEDDQKRKGLFIETLELKLPQVMAFKLFSHWNILQKLNIFGVSKLLPKETTKLYNTSGFIGALIIPELVDHRTFIQAGIALEHLWLIATFLNINFAPVTAIPYLALRIRKGNTSGITDVHQDLILKAEKDIRDTLKISKGEIAMLFRMGYGEKPSARSVRIPVEEKLTIL